MINIEKLAKSCLDGYELSDAEATQILEDKSVAILDILKEAYAVRKQHWNNDVTIHILNNAKNGNCPEDCGYCVQAKTSKVPIEKYPFKEEEEVLEEAKRAYEAGAYRYCMVYSGRGPTKNRVEKLAGMIKKIKETYPIQVCLSPGLLDDEAASKLKEAGLDRLNHNLNTAEEYYDTICSTHTFKDRLNTLNSAQKAGLQICSGIIVGMGETTADIIEVAKKLRSLKAESIPVNFYMHLEGNTLGPKKEELNPEKCLRILSLFRFLNPSAEIRMAAGREIHMRSMQAMGLYPANSLFMEGYLNTVGTNPHDTLEMIKDAGFNILADKDLDTLLTRFDTLKTIESAQGLAADAKYKSAPVLKSIEDLRPTN